WVVRWMSTIGLSPVTVIVSSRAPTRKSASTVATNVPVNSIPSRRTTENPLNVNVTIYVPGRRSTMRYWPLPSVTTERTFSIKTGLEASTVTPGNTAPEGSLTTPVIDACACASVGPRASNPTTNNITPVNLNIFSILHNPRSIRSRFDVRPAPEREPGFYAHATAARVGCWQRRPHRAAHNTPTLHRP